MKKLITLNSQKQSKVKTEKKGTAAQQNFVEMIGYIYLEPNMHTVDSLSVEMGKDARTIKRWIAEINEFCPIINSKFRESDDRAYRNINEKYSEEYFDRCYQESPSMPIVYLFMIMLLKRELSVKEVMEKINLSSREKAMDVINSILDASHIIDYDFREDDLVAGNWKFIY